MLYQHRVVLRVVLDGIDMRLAFNLCVPDLDEETVADAILDFLQPVDDKGVLVPHGRMPMHKARIFLEYFARRFRQYTRHHELREIRIPLIREFSLDTGMLEGSLFDNIRAYKAYSVTLRNAIDHAILKTSSDKSPSSLECATLIAASAALYGALPFEAQWHQIVARCADPLMSDGQMIWFNLEAPRACRWIADPVTEGLLRRLTASGLLPIKGGVPTLEVLLKAVRGLLSLSGSPRNVGCELRNAIVGMQARYFSPDVAALSQGLLSNTPLPHEPWLRWVTGSRHSAPRERISLRTPRTHHASQITTVLELETATVIQRISDAVKSNPNLQRRQGERRDASATQLNNRERVLFDLNKQEQALIDIFKGAGLQGQERQTYAYGLLCYAKDLIQLGGSKRAQLADGTIANYVSLACNKLRKLHFWNLLKLETGKRQDVYSEVICENGLSKRRTDVRTALEGFERSLLRNMDIEDEVDWSLIPGRSRERHLPIADANLIDPALYRCIFDVLSGASSASVLVEMALVLLILLYRFGLRIGEAVELKVAGVVLHSDEKISVRVTRSELTSRKSPNALRTVGPFKLPADEATIIRNYAADRLEAALGRGREKGAAYLFSTTGTSQLEHVQEAQQLLLGLMRDISGDPNLRIRHFRHTFVSAMFVNARNPFSKDELTEHASEWRRALVSGHASPDTGIVSYVHLVELAHYNDTICLVAAEVPLGFLSRVAGNAPRSLERRLFDSEEISPKNIVLRYLASLRKKWECSGELQTPKSRIPYPRLSPESKILKPVSPIDRDWRTAWDIYSAARVGKRIGDDDSAKALRNGVRMLEKNGEMVRRRSRRPQLDSECEVALSRLWLGLRSDEQARRILIGLPERFANARLRVRLPAQIAAALEEMLKASGIKRITSSQSSSQQRWVYVRSVDGGYDSAWMELVLFLCSVCLADRAEE
jgi:integrase